MNLDYEREKLLAKLRNLKSQGKSFIQLDINYLLDVLNAGSEKKPAGSKRQPAVNKDIVIDGGGFDE